LVFNSGKILSLFLKTKVDYSAIGILVNNLIYNFSIK